MEFSYENQGASTYLVYEIKSNDSVDTLSLGMLTNNNIPGIVKTLYMQMDESGFIKYNVSSKISMQQYFSGIVNRKRLLGVFGSIVEGFSAAEDYMLDLNSMVLDPDYIFVDVSICSAALICVPVSNENSRKNDLRTFFKNVMVNTKFDQTENSDHVAKIFNYLNSCTELSLTDFKQLIDELKNEQIGISVQPTVPSSSTVQPQYQQPVQQSAPQVKNVQQASQYNSPAMQQPQTWKASAPQPNNSQPSQAQPSVNNMQNRPVMSVPGNNAPIRPSAAVQNMAVPQRPQSQPQFPQQPQLANGQKKMSMFDLLRHYNKENKEIYRQQKAAQKAQKQAQSTAPQTFAPTQPGFAMPGANPNMPRGTANSNSSNSGFAIPGVNNNASNPPLSPNNGKQAFAAPNTSISGNYPQPSANRAMTNPAPLPSPSPVNAPRGNQVQANNLAPGRYNQVQQNIPQMPASAPAPQSTQAPQPVAPQGQHLNFGETTVLSGNKPGETTVLNGGAQSRQNVIPHLIRTKNGEKIYINKPFFRIGKEKSYVDYFIGDNTAVSRSHANIVTNNNQFFIVDTNSTNHTFVNGSMIQSNINTPIKHGDKIRLGNEEFEFRLY